MKPFNPLLIAAILVAGAAASAQGGNDLLTPRAKDLQMRRAPASSSLNDPDLLKSRPVGNVKAWTLAQSNRVVPSAGRDIDLAHAARPMLSPRDQRYETVLRANAEKSFQVAPLK